MNTSGYELGRHLYAAFRIAGERHVVHGAETPNTDEERAARLIRSMPPKLRKRMRRKLREQARWSRERRVARFGPLAEMPAAEPLTFRQVLARVQTPPLPSSVTAATAPVDPIENLGPGSVRVKKTGLTAANFVGHQLRKVALHMDQFEVRKAQDEFLGFNDRDEITLSVVQLDQTGRVTLRSHDLGARKEGVYSASGEVCSFTIPDGPAQGLPWGLVVRATAIERDGGGYNKAVEGAVEYLQDKVNEFISETLGLEDVPVISKVTAKLASFINGFLDDFFEDLLGIVKNDDDIVGVQQSVVVVEDLSAMFADTRSDQSHSFEWVFEGSDGLWIARCHWSLTADQEAPRVSRARELSVAGAR